MKIFVLELYDPTEEKTEAIGVVLDEHRALNYVLDMYDDIEILDKSSIIISEDIKSNIRGWFSFMDKDGNHYKVTLKPFEDYLLEWNSTF